MGAARALRIPALCVAALSVVAGASACSGGTAKESDAQTLRKAVQPLRAAGSFRMVGSLRGADGSSTAVDARVDTRGNCTGRLGRAESTVMGDRVWTHWDDDAVPDALAALHGGPLDEVVDPVADPRSDPAWRATRLLRGAYLVTDLPGEKPEVEGLAPVCRAGRLLAEAGSGGGAVSAGAVVERDGARVRSLVQVNGPVTVRVYVSAHGRPVLRGAEYAVDGGRTVSVRFSELGTLVAAAPPVTSPVIPARQLLDLLG